MIKWYQSLYMDEGTERKIRKCMKRVEARKLYKKSYTLITLPSNDSNLFDIVDSKELWFRHERNRDQYIVGIASSHESALELLSKIVMDVYEEKKTLDIKNMFSKECFKPRKESDRK